MERKKQKKEMSSPLPQKMPSPKKWSETLDKVLELEKDLRVKDDIIKNLYIELNNANILREESENRLEELRNRKVFFVKIKDIFNI